MGGQFVIAKRKSAKGMTYMPRVYNVQLRAKMTATQLLTLEDCKDLGIAHPAPSAFLDEKFAKRVHRRMEDRVEDWVPADSRPLTVAQWLDRWLSEYPRKAWSTQTHYASMLKPLKAKYGHVLMRDFTRDHARLFAADHRPHVKVAKAAWNDAIYEAELPGLVRNPFDRLKLAPAYKTRDLALTADEVQELAGIARRDLGDWGRVMGGMIVFCAYTGLRFGEMCALEWDWFSKDRRELEVRRQINRRGTATATKTGHGDTKDAEKPPLWIGVPDEARLVLDDLPRSLTGMVFTLPSGRRMSRSGFDWWWRPVRASFLAAERDPRRALEIQKLVWHSLRHSCSTLMAESGVSRWDMQLQMRHNTPALVDSTYTHIAGREARQRVVSALSKPRPADPTVTGAVTDA